MTVIRSRWSRLATSWWPVVWAAGAGAVASGLTVLGGHPPVSLAILGGALTWVSVGTMRRVVPWFDRHHRDGAELWWDLLLLVCVIGALGGLMLMALALPS